MNLNASRRHFMVVLGGMLLAVLGGRVPDWCAVARARGEGTLGSLLSSASAQTLGEACLALPDCARAAAQLARTGFDLDTAELRRRTREDFERGDVVFVDGWVLARTEASVYAYAALINSAA